MHTRLLEVFFKWSYLALMSAQSNPAVMLTLWGWRAFLLVLGQMDKY